MNEIRIWFDGGCSPNPGSKYGSFQIELDYGSPNGVGRPWGKQRIQFGYGTNNEAEFEALIAALIEVGEHVRKQGDTVGNYALRVFTDSTIVRNRLMRNNFISRKPSKRARSQAMHHLATRCLDLFFAFKSYSVEWESRVHNVERFGH